MISVYKKFVLLIAITFAIVVAFYSYSSKANEIVDNEKSNYFKKSLLSYPKYNKEIHYGVTHFVFKNAFVVKKYSSKEKFKIVMKLGLYTNYRKHSLNLVEKNHKKIRQEITKLIFQLKKRDFNFSGLEAFALKILKKSNAILKQTSTFPSVEGVHIIDFLLDGESILKKPNNDEFIQNYVKKKTDKNYKMSATEKKHYSFKHKKRDINNIIFMCAKEVREKYVNPKKFEPVRFSIVPAIFDYYPNMSQITLQGEYNLQKTYASCWVKNKPIKIDVSRIHKINEFSLKTTKFIRIPEEVWKKINKLY